MSILVIGSFMMDLVVRTPRAPEEGETIIGDSFSRFPGGKGANQAVAAARLGEQVTMVGKLGTDQFGEEAIKTLINEGINTGYILRDPQKPTGVGSVTLDQHGSNRIIVVPGANLSYSVTDLEQVEDLIKRSDILIVQLEMDINMIEKAVSIANAYDVPVILNPAPARELSDQLLSQVTYLTPNETEVEILTGIKVNNNEDAEEAGKILLKKGVKNVIITLADKGSLIVNNSEVKHVPSFNVKPVDSVAAGDSFNGALAVGLVRGESIEKAVNYANAVGAITVTKEGAIPSLPTVEEVESFINKSRNIVTK
ncbi:ribokinase [Gracilibacillus sp. D59]|uniref:ribokinase n=1 Tax=Gracilibacillus sp. D59 TaxID=3457434 RepID=UPI003FCCF31F